MTYERPHWTNNLSRFKAIPFNEVVAELERQFDVKITLKDNSAQRLFTGSFTHDNLENALISISQFTDERGLIVALRGQKLIVPAELQFVAERLMESAGRVGTADNDINAVKTNGVIPEGYSVNHYLTDTNAFFITTDVPDGMKHFVRAPMTTSMDGDFETGNVRYKARERYSFGVSDPLGIYGSPGSS